MKIGIVIHSHTGNTLHVGERLEDTLLASGHTVHLERVRALNEDPNAGDTVKLTQIPDITQYDYVIIGAPVRAFSLSPVMRAYLSQLPDMGGKKIACFVTQHFPKPWMGGNRAIKQMIHAVTQKGGKLADKGIINWSSGAREDQINEVLVRLCGI